MQNLSISLELRRMASLDYLHYPSIRASATKMAHSTIAHNAQRASRRDLRHLRWHLQSMTRYFRKYLFRLPVAK